MTLHVDDWVEVRSKEEILATLDKNGRLDDMPFMPPMFKYCGQRFRVFKSVRKTCDTITGEYFGRRLDDGGHLNLRCDGQAYGGCQAGCLMFWKTAWLKPANGPVPVQHVLTGTQPLRESAPSQSSCTEADVVRGATTLAAMSRTDARPRSCSSIRDRLSGGMHGNMWRPIPSYSAGLANSDVCC
jgi:hypothetical protein